MGAMALSPDLNHSACPQSHAHLSSPLGLDSSSNCVERGSQGYRVSCSSQTHQDELPATEVRGGLANWGQTHGDRLA